MTPDNPDQRTAVHPDPHPLTRLGFAGIDHVALTVTNLDVSQRFYTEMESLIADVCARPTLYRRQLGDVRRHFSPTFAGC